MNIIKNLSQTDLERRHSAQGAEHFLRFTLLNWSFFLLKVGE